MAGHVDGMLLVSSTATIRCRTCSPGAASRSWSAGGRPRGPSEPVDIDNAGREHRRGPLLEIGRLPMATIAGPQDMAAGVDRLTGYQEALADAGLIDPSLVPVGDFTRERRHRRDAPAARRPPRARRRVRRLRPHGRGRARGAAPRQDGRCPRTWPWWASTTRPSPSCPTPPIEHPRSDNRSRRWAPR